VSTKNEGVFGKSIDQRGVVGRSTKDADFSLSNLFNHFF
jgi:hypothetical protein